MPPFHLMLDLGLDILLYAVLPAMCLAGAVMAMVVLLGGNKQATLAAALGMAAGAALGLWLREGLTLSPGDSTWNRLPWAALGALWIGRVARLPDLQPSAGWFLRAGAAIGIAWLIIPAETRKEID